MDDKLREQLNNIDYNAPTFFSVVRADNGTYWGVYEPAQPPVPFYNQDATTRIKQLDEYIYAILRRVDVTANTLAQHTRSADEAYNAILCAKGSLLVLADICEEVAKKIRELT